MEMICISAKGIQISFAARPICRGLFSQVLQPPAPASSALLAVVFAAKKKVNKYPICIQFPQFYSLTVCRNTASRVGESWSCIKTENVALGKPFKSILILFS